VWTDIHPDIQPLQAIIKEGNAKFAGLMADIRRRYGTKPPPQVTQFVSDSFDQAVSGVASQFVKRPWPSTFRLIVSPIVTWIWLGAILLFAGALLALWPAPELARGRIRAAYSARLGRELQRS
jgi:cytochrome c-type biogenesis protein CcmF